MIQTATSDMKCCGLQRLLPFCEFAVHRAAADDTVVATAQSTTNALQFNSRISAGGPSTRSPKKCPQMFTRFHKNPAGGQFLIATRRCSWKLSSKSFSGRVGSQPLDLCGKTLRRLAAVVGLLHHPDRSLVCKISCHLADQLYIIRSSGCKFL